MSMGNAATASRGTPAGILTVRNAGEESSLSPDRPYVVGRALECDLVVNDGRVSRRHLMLEPSPDGWTAIDISANGTWHAGERVQRLRIRGECQLRLGAADGPQVTLSPVPPPLLGTDPVADFERGRAEALRTFAAPGVLEKTGPSLGIGIFAASDERLDLSERRWPGAGWWRGEGWAGE